MTCYSCRFSEGRRLGLWCVLWQNWATRKCKKFEYEPGADESEKQSKPKQLKEVR